MKRSEGHGTNISMPISAGDSAGEWPLNRRAFLRLLGAGATALAVTPGAAWGAAGVRNLQQQLLHDEKFWAEVSRMFSLNPSKTFMNIGTAGSLPVAVQDLYESELRKKAREAVGGYTNLLAERTRIAAGFGVDPDEIAFSAGTTSGLSISILGLDWKKGDVVVTTNHEHPGGNTALNIAADRYGIEVSRIELPVGNNQTAALYTEMFDERIKQLRAKGKRVRAMMWSAPTYKTGTMLPIADLMEVVKKYELISIVDGAHLPGMMAYDYGQLGMDFMSGAGHKWQCGPGSTGILIIRNKIRATNPLPLPKWWPIHSMNFSFKERSTNGTATYDIGSALNSLGSLNTPMFAALVKSCQMWDSIGRKKIETYSLALGSYLKEQIAERWGIDSLYSPKDDPKLLSGLTSFNPFANKGDIQNPAKVDEFVRRMLNEYTPGFVIRSINVPVIGAVNEHHPLRISTCLWNNVADVDRLIAAMWDLSKKMA